MKYSDIIKLRLIKERVDKLNKSDDEIKNKVAEIMRRKYE